MSNPVPHTRPSRNRPAPVIYSRDQLRVMFEATDALLTKRAPRLTADELDEAERLLDGLDKDPERFPYPTPSDDPADDEHEEGCSCWLHDDEPAYRGDDAYDMARDLAADRRVT